MSHNTQSAPSYVDPLKKVVEDANAALCIAPGDRLKAKTKIRDNIRQDRFRQDLEDHAETAKKVLLADMNRPGDLTDILLGHIERLIEALKPKNVDISKLSEIYKDINSAFHGADGELIEQQRNIIKQCIVVPLSSPEKGNQQQEETEWWPQPSFEESAAPSYRPYRKVATENDPDTGKNVRQYTGPADPSVLSARTEDDHTGNQSTQHGTAVSIDQERAPSAYEVPHATRSGGIDRDHPSQSRSKDDEPFDKIAIMVKFASEGWTRRNKLVVNATVRQDLRSANYREGLVRKAVQAAELLENLNHAGDLPKVLPGLISKLVEALQQSAEANRELTIAYEAIAVKLSNHISERGDDAERARQNVNTIMLKYIFPWLCDPAGRSNLAKDEYKDIGHEDTSTASTTAWRPGSRLGPDFRPTGGNTATLAGSATLASAVRTGSQEGHLSAQDRTTLSTGQPSATSIYGVPQGTQTGRIDQDFSQVAVAPEQSSQHPQTRNLPSSICRQSSGEMPGER